MAALRSLNLFLLLSLPAVLLGAITRTFVGAFVFAMGAAIAGFILFPLSLLALRPGVMGNPSAATQWIAVICTGVVMAIGVIAALTYQYATRRTPRSRVLAVTAVLAAFFLFAAMPGVATLKIQEWLWGGVRASNIELIVDSTRQQSGPETGGPSTGGGADDAVRAAARAMLDRQMNKQMQKVSLPLRISGMREGDILVSDRIEVRITLATGAVLYRGIGVCVRTNGVGVGCSNNALEVWSGAQNGSQIASEQRLNLPIALYERIKDQPVRVELTYLLTRFAGRPSRQINAASDQLSLPEMGNCATRIDDDGDEIELGCLTNVGVPSCASVVLEDPQTNKRNPELRQCFPNYAPLHRMAWEDAVRRTHLSIPFRDPTELAHYPVGSAAIRHARIIFRAYDPVEHFHRQLVVPNIRLADWKLPDVS